MAENLPSLAISSIFQVFHHNSHIEFMTTAASESTLNVRAMKDSLSSVPSEILSVSVSFLPHS